MLEEHGDGRDGGTAEHRFGREQRANSHKLQFERIPRRQLDQMRPFLRGAPFLEDGLRFDLQELEFDERVVLREIAEVRQHLPRFGFAAVVHEPAGREGHEQESDSQGDAGDQLEADGEEPRGVRLSFAGAADVVGAVVDPETHHDAGGDGELLEGDEAAAHFGRGDFGVVVGDVDGYGADCQA